MKRIVCLSLALLMLLALFAGCGSTASAPAEAPAAEEPEAPAAEPAAPAEEPAAPAAASDPGKGVYTLPLVDEPITLKVFAGMNGQLAQYIETPADSYIIQKLVERTGVELEYRAVNGGNEVEQFTIMIASGEYDDLIVQVQNKYSGGLKAAIEDDVILDLAPLIRENAPNYQAIIDSDPELAKSLVLDDGSIGAFMNLFTEKIASWWGPLLRTDWLAEQGLEKPQTIDEYENMLRVFKSEYGAVMWMNAKGVFSNSMFGSAYGIANYLGLGRSTEIQSYYVDGGTVKTGWMEPGFMDYLNKMHDWYAEGLIDPDFMSGMIDFDWIMDFMCDDVVNGKYGFWMGEDNDIMDYADLNPDMEVGAAYYPVLNKGDAREIGFFASQVNDPGFSISTQCAYPEIAVQWNDYRYSEEGALLMDWGIEGETFEYVNGEPRFTELITNNPDGYPMPIARMLYSGTSPYTYYYKNYYLYPEAVGECMPLWAENYTSAKTFPLSALSYTEQEKDVQSQHLNDVATFVSESIPTYILNGISPDEFEAFKAQLEQLGMNELTAVAQAAYDRYAG